MLYKSFTTNFFLFSSPQSNKNRFKNKLEQYEILKYNIKNNKNKLVNPSTQSSFKICVIILSG